MKIIQKQAVSISTYRQENEDMYLVLVARASYEKFGDPIEVPLCMECLNRKLASLKEGEWVVMIKKTKGAHRLCH